MHKMHSTTAWSFCTTVKLQSLDYQMLFCYYVSDGNVHKSQKSGILVDNLIMYVL
jgi:hypothetical protein